MRRPVLGTLFALACVSILFAVPASAIPIHRHVVRHKTVRIPDTGELGQVAVHRVVVYDVAPPYTPPAPKPVSSSVSDYSTPAPAPAAASVPAPPVSTSSGGCPSYMAGEASSPDAVNPSSGAMGCYQVLPSTQAAFPECSDVNSTSCVAAICAAEGNGAWAASGSTPCDYIKP